MNCVPIARVGACSTLLVILCSCSFTRYKVEEIDYTSNQAAAAILIGDPQVYSRASLINDRRRENTYLSNLLDRSADPDKVKFTPQILRDLKTIEVLSASLGLTFNRGGAAAPGSARDLAQQVEAEKLKLQLAVLEKQIEGIKAATAPTVTIPDPDTTKITPSTPALPMDLTMLSSTIKDVKTELAGLALKEGPNAPSSNYAGLTDPRDDFLDRQAYRRDIRAALSETQLDDTHDYGGNSLYRLQFQATVMPPRLHNRQWGAAKLSIEPPEITGTEIAQLYVNWLNYVSRMASASNLVESAKRSYGYSYYLPLVGKGFFELVDLYSKYDPEFDRVCFRRDSIADYQVQAFTRGLDKFSRYVFYAGRDVPYALIGTFAVPTRLASKLPCSDYKILGRALTTTAGRMKVLSDEDWQVIRQIAPVDTTAPSAAFGLSPLRYNGKDAILPTLQFLPPKFCELLVNSRTGKQSCDSLPTTESLANLDSMKWEAASSAEGDSASTAVRSYSILPVELAQRLGATTESSQSLQAALAVAGQFSAPLQGLFSGGILKQEDVRTQALEREPLVLGFAGTQSVGSKSSSPGRGYFGWLLGPAYSIDDERALRLRQTVRSFGVTADISFPGWWTSMLLNVETAWIGSWSDKAGLDVFDEASVASRHSVKRVTIPATDDTFEELTKFIAQRTHRGQFTRLEVTSVTPNVLPACGVSNETSLQISGTNIWRASSVLLGSTAAREITVLPDMKGITAQFDMTQVFGALVSKGIDMEAIPLTVSAQQGEADPLPVYVVGTRVAASGSTTCSSPIAAPTRMELMPTMVLSTTPNKICADAKRIPLVVRGFNLPVAAPGGTYPPSDHSSEANKSRKYDCEPLRDGDNNEVRPGGCYQSNDFEPVGFYGDEMNQTGILIPDHSLKAGRDVSITVTGFDRNRQLRSASFPLTVDECKSDVKAAKKDDSEAKDAGGKSKGGTGDEKKAALQTTSVKLAKDQIVSLIAPIPAAYTEVTVAVRPATESNDAKWTSSAPVNPSPGDKSTVNATLDLSKIDAKPEAKLDVQLRIRTRPDLQWKRLAVDKSLVVAKP